MKKIIYVLPDMEGPQQICRWGSRNFAKEFGTESV